eukprot:m.123739 g.123739  ORF g.123739 m.123739 type:complete len:368 (+) comp14453_c0_seq1:155-1258(+)
MVEDNDKQYKELCISVLKDEKLWNSDPEQSRKKYFPELQALAKERLQKLATTWDEKYKTSSHGKVAKSIQDKQGSKARQETALPKLFKIAAQTKEKKDSFHMVNRLSHGALVGALKLISLALEPLFIAKMKEIATKHNATFRAPGVKSVTRMIAKFKEQSEDGHEYPQAAANVDINRCCISYATPEALGPLFADVISAAEGGVSIRTKNMLLPSFPAVSQTFGYRAIMINMVFDAQISLGEIWPKVDDVEKSKLKRELTLNNIKAQEQPPMNEHNAHLINFPASYGLNFPPAGQYFDSLLLDHDQEWYMPVRPKDRQRFRSLPVKSVVEVQLVPKLFLDMRRKSHLWYKIVRAGDFEDMRNDFVSAW